MSQLKTAGRKEFPLVIKGDVQGSVEAIVGARSTSSAPTRSPRASSTPASAASPNPTSRWRRPRTPHHRLQRPRQRQAREARRARRHRDPLLQHHLRPRRRREGGDVRPARAERCARPCSATPRSSRSSTSPRSARSPAAASPTARSSAAPSVRLIRDNVVIHEGKLSTLKRFKDEVARCRRPGMRHGLRELPGHARRRRHRVLPRRARPNSASASTNPSTKASASTRCSARPTSSAISATTD
jgi:translation initiation factor IF-2